jgi:hypothetical protein
VVGEKAEIENLLRFATNLGKKTRSARLTGLMVSNLNNDNIAHSVNNHACAFSVLQKRLCQHTV